MEKHVELKIEGLQCDNCDFVDMSVKREDYEKSIDKPCPKCGENLLTVEDYNSVLILEKAVEMTNNTPIEEIERLTANIPTGVENEIMKYIVNTHKGIEFIQKDE